MKQKTAFIVLLLISLFAVFFGLAACNSSLPQIGLGAVTVSPADQTATAYDEAQRLLATDNALLSDKANAEMMALSARQTSEVVYALETSISRSSTEQAISLTASAESRRDTATAQIVEPTLTIAAIQVIGTLTAIPGTQTAVAAADTATATAKVAEDAVKATSTDVALDIVVANSQVQTTRIANQGRVDRTTDEVVIWLDKLLPRAVIAVISWLLIWGAWLILRRLVPVLATIAGVIRHGKNGKPNLVLPTADGGVVYADLSRNDGPVLHISGSGQTESPIQSSENTLARAGLENLALALNQPEGQSNPAAQNLLRQARPQARPNQPYAIFPPGQTPSLPADQSDIIEAAWREAQTGFDLNNWEQAL